ncbi:PDZ domain-containing protein, partial [bacterium]|nr:PDZ domain-containing protein [bacterium]
AAINPGNSGGALSNLAGEVVGINTAIASRTGGYMGVGFAIPINLAKDVMDQLIETGVVKRGWLGISIQDVTPALRETFGLDEGVRGALVAEVLEDTPAERAGMEVEDIVVEVDGEKVESANDLRNRVAAIRPGKKVRLGVLREGERLNLAVNIGERPADLTPVSTAPHGPSTRQNKETVRGITVGLMTPDVKSELGYDGDTGVVVLGVERYGEASRAGIFPGMVIVRVNGTPVDDPEEFAGLIEKTDGPALLYVWTGGRRSFIALPED